jgi:lantibiotic modifying enzyme
MDDLLEVAFAIGERLAREAIWHEGRCNWVGGTLGAGEHGELAEFHAALDASLYEGTSGVGLVLAELHAATGAPELRHTALGAIRQALDAAGGRDLGPGLYSGATGVAIAAARAGSLLGEDEPVERAGALAGGVAAGVAGIDPHGAESDLLDGLAGTALGLLALARMLGRDDLAAAAATVGEGLLATAQEDGGGLSWPSTMPTKRNLTGFSHGAAGIGYALLQLGAATGEDRFADAGERAFDYERDTYDAGAGNWPDYRDHAGTGGVGFVAYWCHGAPGIALSRLAALERTGRDRYRDEAESALAVVHGTVARELEHGGGNYSLCHGLAGNAEILADGARALGGRWSEGQRLALDVAAAGAETHGARGRWPGGAGSVEAYGLLLGLAGIARFYARLALPELPSLLRPHPVELATS